MKSDEQVEWDIENVELKYGSSVDEMELICNSGDRIRDKARDRGTRQTDV